MDENDRRGLLSLLAGDHRLDLACHEPLQLDHSIPVCGLHHA